MPRYPAWNDTITLGDPLNELVDGGHPNPGIAYTSVDMCLVDGKPWVMFIESAYDAASDTFIPRGPFVKKWDGFVWTTVGTEMEPSALNLTPYEGSDPFRPYLSVGDRTFPIGCSLATDGTTVYAAYSIKVGADTPDGEGTWDAYVMVIKYFDGSDWALVVEEPAECYNTYRGVGLLAGIARGTWMGPVLGASPNNPGVVYSNWYEEGPQSGTDGINAHTWIQRDHVRGYQTDGTQVFDYYAWTVDYPGGFSEVNGDGATSHGNFRVCYASGNGTVWAFFVAYDLNLSMLDLMADALSSVSVDPASIFNAATLIAQSVSQPYTRGSDPEVFYFGAMIEGGFLPAQVATDGSGFVDQIHKVVIEFVPNTLYSGVLLAMHALDDKNVVFCVWRINYFGESGVQWAPVVWKETCGIDAVPGGVDLDAFATGLLGSVGIAAAFDPATLLMYTVSGQAADGSIIGYASQLVMDKLGCGGNPIFNNSARRQARRVAAA